MKMRQLITRKPKYVIVILIFAIPIVMLLTFGLMQINATASAPAGLDEVTLVNKSIDFAHKAGLRGTPKSQKNVRMTLGEWAKLNGGELGKDAGKFGLTPTLPVFVMALRGKVISNAPIELPPDQPEPQYSAIVVVLDANTGEPITWGYYEANDVLPFDVP